MPIGTETFRWAASLLKLGSYGLTAAVIGQALELLTLVHTRGGADWLSLADVFFQHRSRALIQRRLPRSLWCAS
jgi:hypothetical protein